MPSDAVSEPAGEVARCVRLVSSGPRRRPLPGAESDPALAAELNVFPPDVRRTVFAAGLEPAISRLLRDRKDGLSLAELMTRRQAIELHLHSLKVQVDSTTFEADCTGDVIEGVQTDLDTRNNVHAVRWTVASTVTGALTAASAGTWDLAKEDSRAPAIIGIVGGLTAGALALGAFADPNPPIVLDHHRNLLTPIVTGKDPDEIYPPFVFRLLTLPEPNGPSPREALHERLKALLADAVDPRDRERAELLLYGPGGIYDRSLLDTRERMLDEVESTVAAFARDVELLTRYLNRTIDLGCIAPSSAEGCPPDQAKQSE